MVAREGFAPPTQGFSVLCSTPELSSQKKVKNYLVGAEGSEPPTPWSQTKEEGIQISPPRLVIYSA